jgi:hypothetical protein
VFKLVAIIGIVIFLASVPEPEDLTLEPPRPHPNTQPEDLSLDGASAAAFVEQSALDIATIPHGAMVYLDGERFGITPITGKGAAYGDHYLSLRMDGYLPYDKDIYISGDGAALVLPMVEAPAGYRETLRKAESDARASFDLDTAEFRRWLHLDERHASKLIELAESFTRLGESCENAGLDYDALRCRNTAAGFYMLLELASGTDYFAESPDASRRLFADQRQAISENERAIMRLILRFEDCFNSLDEPTRAVAAHALRHTYSSLEGSGKAMEILKLAGEIEYDGFVSLVISEAMEQIEFVPMEES